jgi:TonB family protein
MEPQVIAPKCMLFIPLLLSLAGCSAAYVDTSVPAIGGAGSPQVNQRTAPSGDPSSVEYVSQIFITKLTDSWDSRLAQSMNKWILLVSEMDRNGTIVDVYVERSSGNRFIDNSAIEAVQKVGAIEEVQNLNDADFELYFKKRRLALIPNRAEYRSILMAQEGDDEPDR